MPILSVRAAVRIPTPLYFKQVAKTKCLLCRRVHRSWPRRTASSDILTDSHYVYSIRWYHSRRTSTKAQGAHLPAFSSTSPPHCPVGFPPRHACIDPRVTCVFNIPPPGAVRGVRVEGRGGFEGSARCARGCHQSCHKYRHGHAFR